jgi:hypothetical protein
MSIGDLYGAVARYAGRLHAAAGARHHVASPLGARLLLALCVPAADPETRAELATVLGIDPDVAYDHATALLERPHRLVASAAAVWHLPGSAQALAGWLSCLPEPVTSGDLPDQAVLDAWAREHTYGLIDRFPLDIVPEVELVLANALATKVSWQVPFDVVPVDAAGTGNGWVARVQRLLRTPQEPGHHAYIAGNTQAGDVAVHVAEANAYYTNEQLMVSVIADQAVPSAAVLAAAHDVAAAAAQRVPVHRSLFDLPLTETPLWTVREEPVLTSAISGREEVGSAVLPAWSASSEHNLNHKDLGIPAASEALARLLGLKQYLVEAKQAAVAQYTRTGFEAAAVTGVAAPTGFVQPEQGLRRIAELRFRHPYAVVAVATQSDRAGNGTWTPGPWHGLPVFSAWVTEPDETAA